MASSTTHPAALPGGMEQFGDRGLEAVVGIGDHQLDAAQPALAELAQKAGPEGFRFRRADIHAQNLATAITIGADCHDHGHRDDPAVLADLHVGRVEPEIGPLVASGLTVREAAARVKVGKTSLRGAEIGALPSKSV
jgi:hypothetical protein